MWYAGSFLGRQAELRLEYVETVLAGVAQALVVVVQLVEVEDIVPIRMLVY